VYKDRLCELAKSGNGELIAGFTMAMNYPLEFAISKEKEYEREIY